MPDASPDRLAQDAELAALIRRGEHLEGYDLARRRIEREGVCAPVARAAVLCLARSGATDFARMEYARWRLGEDPGDVETAALGARLLKDVALASDGPRRRAFARASAARYAAVHARHGGRYSAINSATMSLLAGEFLRARRLAEHVLALPMRRRGGESAYYDLASRAEALVLLGRAEAAADAMQRAIANAPHSYPAHASTVRQLDLVLRETGADRVWLDSFRPPAVAHYTGRIFASSDSPSRQHQALEAAMRRLLTSKRIGVGFGSLAAGADILWAEALLARGADLHVVLPTSTASFIATSVLPFGTAWGRRFEACLAAARSVRLAIKDPYTGDDQVFAYSSRFAIGCAVLRAEALATDAVQIVATGDAAREGSGVDSDLAYWAQTGRPQHSLRLDTPALTVEPRSGRRLRTAMKAMLFVDVRGFGTLRDDQVPAFFDVVMTGIARSIGHLATAPQHVETWGDGVFLVFDQPVDAAEAAVAILAGHRRLNLGAHELPRWLALRIGGHFGPVHSRINPILGTQAFVGAHVVVAARIEPNVAPGSAYVSEAFAAVLATFHGDRFQCGYVGRTKARHDFPPMSIFNLARRRSPPAAPGEK